MKECYGITVGCERIATYHVQREIDAKPLHLCPVCLLAMVRVEMRANAHQKLDEIAGAVDALSGKLVGSR